MEHNNIEKLIKDTFSERAIEPSTEARERLNTLLNSKSKKKNKIWLPYAAAGAVLFGLWFFGSKILFKNPNLEQIIPVITTKEAKQPLNSIKPKESPDQNFTPELITLTNKVVITETNLKLEIKNKTSTDHNSALKYTVTPARQEDLSKATDRIAINQLTNTVQSKELAELSKETEKSIIERQSLYVTAKDLLVTTDLDSSIRLIQNKKKQSTSYVNSNQLLIEMEKQLFEEKNKNVFSKARKQLNKIKEVVADRNYKN